MLTSRTVDWKKNGFWKRQIHVPIFVGVGTPSFAHRNLPQKLRATGNMGELPLQNYY
jgi:hypothetical protein